VIPRLSHYGRRGVLLSQDKGSDRTREAKLKACVHCGLTWLPRPGSGRLAGFCTRCMGDVCGQPACVARGCLPNEAQIEMLEAGIPFELTHESLRPVSVSVPRIVEG